MSDRPYQGSIDTSFSLLIHSSGGAAYHCVACGQILPVPTADGICVTDCTALSTDSGRNTVSEPDSMLDFAARMAA